jgi:RimJ/RimL family protein N-acetyltransferase
MGQADGAGALKDKSMVTLETERLNLRLFCQSDLDTYAAMCGDVEVMRYLGDGKPLSRAEAWRHMALIIGHWQLRGFGMWAVEEKGTGRLIGRVGAWFPEGWPGKEIAWTLCRESWGRGFATEAARAAMAYAFTTLDWPEVISLIRPANAASIRVAERIGEQLSGTAQVLSHEVLVYRLSRERWQAGQS